MSRPTFKSWFLRRRFARTGFSRGPLQVESLEQRTVPAWGPVGSELLVNSYTTNSQSNPAVGADGSGNFIVAWDGLGTSDASGGVFLQRYDASGTPVGSNILVNTSTTNTQQRPAIAVSASGSFVVAWQSSQISANSDDIYFQRFDSSGNKVGSETRVNTHTTGTQQTPTIAMDSSGSFVVVYNSYGPDGANGGIVAQRFDASGVALGTEFVVNSHTSGAQTNPSIAMDANGNFAIAYDSHYQDGSNFGVYARRYNSAGNALGLEFQVPVSTLNSQSHPRAAYDTSGNLIFAWQSSHNSANSADIYFRRFDSAGSPLTGEILVNQFVQDSQTAPSLAVDGSGNEVVTWSSKLQDGSESGIYVRRFDSSGIPLGPEPG
jgi:hypothetical protein